MLRALFSFNWRESPAHLLFLSKFLRPRTVDDFSKSDAWKAALKESPSKAVQRFLKEGMLEYADLAGLLEYGYRVSDLKSMLKERGLPVSGRKRDLIERLIQSEPDGMKRSTRGLRVLQCSQQGRAIAEQYLASEKEKRVLAEQQVLDLLGQRRFREASLLVASYESKQVFPRGLGIDWENYDPTHDVEVLNIIFKSKPRILAHLNDEHLEHLRIAAGMMHLWGTNRAKGWLPPGFKTMLSMDNDTAARMMIFYATHQIQMAQYRKLGVKKIKIITANDTYVCEACQKMASKEYRLSQVPELPYEKCTCEMGCRCTAVVADL